MRIIGTRAAADGSGLTCHTKALVRWFVIQRRTCRAAGGARSRCPRRFAALWRASTLLHHAAGRHTVLAHTLKPYHVAPPPPRFDAFLKENDEKVQEAIRRADAEAKVRRRGCRRCNPRRWPRLRFSRWRCRVWRSFLALLDESRLQSLPLCARAHRPLPTRTSIPLPPPPPLRVRPQAKADRVAEIKRLNAAIAALKSEMGKREELLSDCDK